MNFAFVWALIVLVVSPDHFEETTIHHFQTRSDFLSSILGDSLYFDVDQSFQAWTPDLLLQCHLKVVHVSLLRWLRDTSPSLKSFPTVVTNCVHEIIGQVCEQQHARNGSASSSFSCVAICNNYILLVFVEKLQHFMTTYK